MTPEQAFALLKLIADLAHIIQAPPPPSAGNAPSATAGNGAAREERVRT